MRKFLPIIIFLFLLLILLPFSKEVKSGVEMLFRGEVEEIQNIEQVVPVKIENSDLEFEEETVETGINIPSYWKYGIPQEEMDFLKGYVPNINDFMEYFKIKQSILFGVETEASVVEVEQLGTTISSSNSFLTKGIPNGHTGFEWSDDSCVVVKSENFSSPLFLCTKWMDWMGGSLSTHSFVLTECSVKELSGFCVFRDYVDVYYLEKKSSDSRCFANGLELCDIEKYRDLAKSK